jgi:hypothetical protein
MVVFSYIENISSVIRDPSYIICTSNFVLKLPKFLYCLPMIFLMYILDSFLPSSFFNINYLIASFTPLICYIVPDIFKSIVLEVPKIAFSP